MIVAVPPIKLSVGARSKNIAAVLRAIRVAAELHPAPDLVILGDLSQIGCIADNQALLTSAMCQAVCETLSHAAKEWGIWILAPHAHLNDSEAVRVISLFDPDGDVYIRHDLPESAQPAQSLSPNALYSTPVGLLAFADCEQLIHPEPSAAATPNRPDLLLTGIAHQLRSLDEPHLTCFAEKLGCAVVAVTSACTQDRPDSDFLYSGTIFDKHGKVITGSPHATSHGIAVADYNATMPAVSMTEALLENHTLD